MVDKHVVVGTLEELRNLDHPGCAPTSTGRAAGRRSRPSPCREPSLEIRASYVIVGAVVLALLTGLAAFSLWLVEAGVDRDDLARYEIAFAGSVSGLQQGGQVLYRGIPVGRVNDIRIDPDNVETVLVMVEVDRETPIKADTVATLEFQGLTGIAYVQLRGGTQASARLDPNAKTPPRIASRSSALERVFRSTPELLARTVAVVDRLGLLLTDENLEALAGTLRNVESDRRPGRSLRRGRHGSRWRGGHDRRDPGNRCRSPAARDGSPQLTGRLDQQVAGVAPIWATLFRSCEAPLRRSRAPRVGSSRCSASSRSRLTTSPPPGSTNSRS